MSEWDIAKEMQEMMVARLAVDPGQPLDPDVLHGVDATVPSVLNSRLGLAMMAKMTLELTEAYYWAPSIFRVMEDASQSVPNSWVFTPDVWPSKRGFFWLDCTWDTGDPNIPFVKAVSWVLQTRGRDVQRPLPMPELREAAFVVFWGTGTMRRAIPDLIEVHLVGCDWSLEMMHKVVWEGVDAVVVERAIRRVKMLASMLAFLKQSILIPSHRKVSRAAARRIERETGTTNRDVRVVTLRRRVYRPTGEPRDVEWTCQWLVQGHWREQWYPSRRRHQPKYILPYVKGPEDKPLKGGQRLFAVVR